MATVDKTSVAISVSCQVDCLVPTLQRLLLVITRSQLQACSVGGVEMWVLSASPAERRGEHSHFSSSFLQTSTVIADFLIMFSCPSPGEVSSEIPFGTSGCLPPVLQLTSPHGTAVTALQSATDGKTESRGVFMCPNCMGVDRRGEQILSSLKEAETGHQQK